MNSTKKNTSTLLLSKSFKILKLNSVFLTLLALAFLIISCEKPQKPQQENIKPTEEMLAHIVNIDKAKNLYNNYKEQRIDITKDTLKKLYGNDFEDTRTIWFDLKTIKNYIAYVEQKSAENNIEPEGLQFYFSVYADDMKEQSNQQTFFIAPTIKRDNKHFGYTLERKGEKEHILLLKDVLTTNKHQTQQSPKVDKASFFTTTTTAENGLLYNDGNNSPPFNND